MFCLARADIPVKRALLGVPIAILLVGGCSQPDSASEPALRTAAYGGQAAMNEVLREVGSVTLEQDSSHPVGGIGDLAVDTAGRVYLADMGMRELKAWNADGSFVGVVGSAGEGPGEYLLPSNVDVHPQTGEVGVVDPLGRRLVTYDPGTLQTTGTRRLEAPVSTVKMVLGGGDTVFLAGVASNYRETPPYVAAVVADSVVRRLLPLPEALQHRAFGGSYISGFFDRVGDIMFMGIRGSPIVYRLDLQSARLDSVALPPSFYELPDLPGVEAVREGSRPNLQALLEDTDWTNAVVALDANHVLVDKMIFSKADELWRHEWGLLSWTEEPSLVSFPPCHCSAVRGRDGVGILEGFYPRPYTMTWYKHAAADDGSKP